jgi:hypothetical protein
MMYQTADPYGDGGGGGGYYPAGGQPTGWSISGPGWIDPITKVVYYFFEPRPPRIQQTI